MPGKRPEHTAPPQLFYNETEAGKYSGNSHMISIQSDMSERALQLLALPDDVHCLLLDIGCGSGLSGEVLSEAGHHWVGLDISEHMLDVAVQREVEGDLIQRDIGHGVPFRPGTFDGAISISALQWLCNADTKEHNPKQRLFRFFSSLYAAMVALITAQSTRAGFTGGLVVDFPNSTRAKKVYLVLFTGGQSQLPSALTETNVHSNTVPNAQRRREKRAGGASSQKAVRGSKDWILNKKEQYRKKGKDTAADSKYTGRKRRRRF